MAIVGDTIRLKAKFYTWTGVVADPENIKLRIFNSYRKQLGEDIQIGHEHRVGAGTYQYEYTPTGQEGSILFFEFSGTLEGMPITNRSKVPIEWIKPSK